MKKRNFVVLISVAICLLLTGACASVPKDAIILSSTVTDGIKRMQIENEKVIKAFVDVQRNVLDETYEKIYVSVENKYIKDKSIQASTPLTKDQQLDITANVIAVRDEILKHIQTKEEELLAHSRANSEKVIEINEQVKKYLKSLSDLNDANDKIKKLLGEMTGVNLDDISDLIKKKIS